MDVKPGGWFRTRTVDKGEETFTDWGLKERGAGYLVVVSLTGVGSRTAPETLNRFVDLNELGTSGEKRIYLAGKTLDFDRMETPGQASTARWILKDGRHAGVVLPSEWRGERFDPRRFDEQKLTLKGREFDCLIVEGVVEPSEQTVRLWLSPECPVGPVRAEGPDATRSLVDFGDDWTNRPPFPEPAKAEIVKVVPPPPADPPKPEAPPTPEPPKPAPTQEPPKEDPALKAKKSMAQAAMLIREATPVFRQIAESVEKRPKNAAAFAAVLKQAEETRQKLTDAASIYAGLKESVADRALLESRMNQIGDLVRILDQAIATLRERAR